MGNKKHGSAPQGAGRAFAIALAALFAHGEASAQTADQPAADSDPFVSEVRIGVFAHDQAPLLHNTETGTDINAEVLFAAPDVLDRIGAPRPHVGVTYSLEGTSHAYAGLTWERDFNGGWFLTGGLGLAVHDGDPLDKDEQDAIEFETEKALGCRVNIHWGIGAGYRISEHWNVALHYEHLSNAYLCVSNEGLENIGLRVGRRF